MPFLQRPNGCRLFYEVFGAGDPLVLLEGMGGDVTGWRRSIPTLAGELRVVAGDFRGNGRSDGPDEPMTIGTLADDTLALLDHLHIDAAHLYGQSLGGMVAQELAVTRPERVRSLILAATYPGPAHAVRHRDKAPKGEPWRLLYSARFAEEHAEHIAEDLRAGAERPQPAGAARRQWEAIQAFDSYDRLPSIAVPTLVLHGTEDRMIHPDNARILAERIPGARLVLLDGAGHAYHSERSEAADAAILEFVRALRA
jgi:pimeloyl-ACP methyl ester carboxylesterase